MSETLFSVRVVNSEAEISPALWDACFPPPLEGRWWFETLENSGFEGQFTFAYGVILENAREVGIAPIFLMNVPLASAVAPWLRSLVRVLEKIVPSIFCPRTLFVGAPGAEEGTVGLLPGVDRRGALLCLQRSLEIEARRLRASMIIWKDFPESYDNDLNQVAHAQNMFRMVSYPNTVMTLPAGSKDDYLTTVKRSRRVKLKKKLRLSHERVALETEIVQRPDEPTLDRMFALYLKTYEKSDIKFEALTRKFFAAVAVQPMSYFVILREKQTGEMLAFGLCFDLQGTMLAKYVGIDYEKPREWFLYFRLWEAELEFALAQGASSIKDGQTAYGAKFDTGHTLVPLTNYGKHRNFVLHAIYRAIATHTSWETLDDQLAEYLKAHSANS